jgi:DNA helicase-2/ATP-dependent DNA helicase PcrA
MNELFENVVQNLATSNSSVSVTAAAGCGKTEAIAQAVAIADGKHLVLTHTNAGVAALRSRLRKYSVSESKYRVETIASWLLKYAIAYPSMSGFENPHPQGTDWNEVYPAAQNLLSFSFITDILQTTYQTVFIDEYQDCTQSQHKVITKISEYLPVRILGDPLQGIFGFHEQTVNWQIDIEQNFQPLPDLQTPFRWSRTNPTLGLQLSDIRNKLLNNEQIDLENFPDIDWYSLDNNREIEICENARMNKTGTVVGIHQWPSDAHSSAKKMKGKYQSIEEMDCNDLMIAAQKIDNWRIQKNYQAIKNEVKNFILKGCGNRSPFQDPNFLETEFLELEQGNLSVMSRIVEKTIQNSKMHVFRRELFCEMKKAVEEFSSGESESFEEAAYKVRYKTRINGRRPEKRIISRTLLIKGLEFDHALVLNADSLQNKENFYVAITRGSRSLTILSKTPLLHYSENS